MALPISLTRSQTLNNPSENPTIPKPPIMWPNEKKPQPPITQISYSYSYSAKPPHNSNQEETQITYLNLPKIPLRIRSLPSDLSLLGTQFWDTLIVLQHLLYRRTFARRQATPPLQQQDDEYQLLHLHTNPQITIHELSYSLTLNPSHTDAEIPLIFPVAPGIWELLIKKPHLANLMLSSSEFPMNFELPSQLPKGIVGRAAQIRAAARGKDRWVWGVHLAVLERFPWNHIMKDTAESMSIRQEGCVVVGGSRYVL
ncbi:MAG: hypothetical protein L6R36_004706 [Xanthoria steineri]|nr:MAG: hypothetical protein L6R36_004706 [Xanthoria steineri]